jgi:hypothetical protein
MNIWAKCAILFLCAAICALSVTLIPRAEQMQTPNQQTTPVKLREAKRSDWLLV